ncbi:MAG: ABC transporter ATP-binding protein [Clostridia bacterium]|nr:ABC transporter ATP-binding protein [Clostridia bacterium]
MIKLENVTKKYNDFVAVNNISFDIKEGEIVGFLGKNGAGKTTTMNMITGYIEPTEGKIEINGYDINKNPKKAKNEIGYMPEGVPIYNDLTVKEFVNYMADLKGVKRENKKANVQKVIEETGLSEVQNKLNRHLSRGYKQRVSMAGALVGNPKVLILDEPTVGLDPQQVKQIRDLIKSLRKDHTVLISSHILSEVSQICEKVIIIDRGNILAVDTPENLESKVSSQNILTVTVEDTDNKINDIINKIDNIKKIELISENSDGTKQYTIFAKKDKDIRKEISEKFAKSGITILELKKTEATLEEAFLQLINNYSNKENKEDKKDEDNNEKRGGKE